MGCGRDTYFRAVKVRRLFGLAGNHKFEFQDGSLQTLREHFEPQILGLAAGHHPMGLGEVLKGCGWFVDEEGKIKNHKGPGERNSYLHYFESSWRSATKQFGRWEKLKGADRERAMELVAECVKEWPAEVVAVVIAEGKKNLTQSRR